MNRPNKKIDRQTFWISVGTLAAVLYAFVTVWQAWLMRESVTSSNKQLQIDQRAWVGVVFPKTFTPDGTSIPATIQVTSFGKTPARQVEGLVIATIFKNGQELTFDYGIPNSKNQFFTGIIFPNNPFNVTLTFPVAKYTGMPEEPILNASDLSKELSTGDSYIAFFGEIIYTDIFGNKHWTHFCTVTGKVIDIDTRKKCIAYNDVDHDGQ
jgi:hypothetical protein